MDEIVNKVANSALEVFDLEDYYPKGIRTQIDISQWLFEGFILKEKINDSIDLFNINNEYLYS